MLSEMCRINGQAGLKLMYCFGQWVVVANRARLERDTARKWTVINHREEFVESVHANEEAAVAAAWDAYREGLAVEHYERTVL